MGKLQPNEIRRIVVRTPTWVGDAVMSLPALHELRRLFPEARITVVSPPGSADIFLDSDTVDNILIQQTSGFFAVFSNAREWRRQRFDLAVLFQNAFAAAASAFLARVPLRIGYATDRRSALLSTSLPVPTWKDERHESFYYLNIIRELGRTLSGAQTVETEPIFNLLVSEERKQSARQMLSDQGADFSGPLAILCPGSINSRAKRWPAERYAELADRLTAAGMNVVLIGSPGELDVSRQVMAQAKHKPIALTGKTSVAEVVALISVAGVLITNDTGPAHIGAALGTPTLVIFGPTNPLTTYPFSAKAQVIREPPDCAPCMLRDCPIDHRCMTAISPSQVFQKTLAVVAERGVQVSG